MRRSIIACGVLVLGGLLGWTQTAHAQRPGSDTSSGRVRQSVAAPARPPACCTIVRIDTARSIVTGRETATGFTFRFEVKTRRILGTLKVGQPIWADFAGKSVKLNATDAAPCCGIVTRETP